MRVVSLARTYTVKRGKLRLSSERSRFMHLSIKYVATCALFVGMLSVAQDARAIDCSTTELIDTCETAPPPVWKDGQCYGQICSRQYIAGCRNCVVECHAW